MSILKTSNIDKFFTDPVEFQVLKKVNMQVAHGEFLSLIESIRLGFECF